MEELLGGLPVGQLGLLGALVLTPWALLAFVVRRIVTGDLVARQALLDVQADRDYWRAATDSLQGVTAKQGMTQERLLEYAETANHALTEISNVVLRSPGSTS